MKAHGPALLLAIQSACTLAPYEPPPAARAMVSNGPVVAGAASPEIALEGFSRGRLDALGDGAGATLVGCLAAVADSALSEGGRAASVLLAPSTGEPTLQAAVLVVMLGICSAASSVGGVVGVAIAPRAETVLEAETTVRSALMGNPIQAALRDSVLARARSDGTDLVSTPPEDAGARLEVAITRVSTAGIGVDPPLRFSMSARARILRASDDAELYAADYLYHGDGSRTLREWAADGGAPLLRALESGYESLGAQIFENVFTSTFYPFPDRELHRSGPFADDGSFGLAPLLPTTHRGCRPSSPSAGYWFDWEEVTSLQPTLRWQSFPRASDSAWQPAEMSRVTNVRYDLRVAREDRLEPAEVVYERDGLPAAEHRLEQPLLSQTGYFWTVRARFELDGRTHLTNWSATVVTYEAQGSRVPVESFCFRTP